ncbi:S41 family peptidase [Glaciecola sp.]|jgi:C-terminal processing protease CtpA/Prc|nr:S41 family peptidase [Glaciecola sp.]
MKAIIACVCVCFSVFFTASLSANTLSINVHSPDQTGLYIIGQTPPLSMDNPIELLRKGDNYQLSLWLPNTQPGQTIRYQFITLKPAVKLGQTPVIVHEPIQGFRQTKLSGNHTQTKHTFGVPDTINFDAVDKFTPAQLQADLAIVQLAFTQVHAGANRYLDDTQLKQIFSQTKQNFSQALSVKDAYLGLSKLAASLQCGHTHTGIYNQSALIDQLTLAPANKLPVLFQNIQNRWYITHNLSDKSIIRPGTEIIAINNIEVATISETLAPYLSVDGDNNARRAYLTQLLPTSSYQLFDAYFPLLFGQDQGDTTYKLTLRLPNTSRQLIVDVNGRTLKQRQAALVALKPELADVRNSFQFRTLNDDQIGYLKIGTFATYNFDFDWQEFYSQAFAAFNTASVEHLIIDIRGNGGGLDLPMLQLGEFLSDLVNQSLPFSPVRPFATLPESIKPYLKTWDQRLYTQTSMAMPTLEPVDKTFSGKVWLLVDGANASATFMLAKQYQDAGIATLVGQSTGGNLRGINGGGMFFLTLPNTQIEIDIPIFQYLPTGIATDKLNTITNQGLMPDVMIEVRDSDIQKQTDGVLNRLIQTISEDDAN